MIDDQITKQIKLAHDRDKLVLDQLTESIDNKAERSKHVLQALVSACVPLDYLTAEILSEIGGDMQALYDTEEETTEEG